MVQQHSSCLWDKKCPVMGGSVKDPFPARLGFAKRHFSVGKLPDTGQDQFSASRCLPGTATWPHSKEAAVNKGRDTPNSDKATSIYTTHWATRDGWLGRGSSKLSTLGLGAWKIPTKRAERKTRGGGRTAGQLSPWGHQHMLKDQRPLVSPPQAKDPQSWCYSRKAGREVLWFFSRASPSACRALVMERLCYWFFLILHI